MEFKFESEVKGRSGGGGGGRRVGENYDIFKGVNGKGGSKIDIYPFLDYKLLSESSRL